MEVRNGGPPLNWTFEKGGRIGGNGPKRANNEGGKIYIRWANENLEEENVSISNLGWWER